jgi:uncharacterized protein (TIGR02145 family)
MSLLKQFGNGPAGIKEIIKPTCSGLIIWMLCSVVTTLIPPSVKLETEILLMRWVALTFSFIFAYGLLINTDFKLAKEPKNKYRFNAALIVLANGVLIFLNAVGCNSISTGTSFEKRDAKIMKSSIFPFLKDICWWPDIQLLSEITVFKKQNRVLNYQIDSLKSAWKKDISSNIVSHDTIYSKKCDTVYMYMPSESNNISQDAKFRDSIRKPPGVDVISVGIPVIRIGDQQWMHQNLDADSYSDGTLLGEAHDLAEWKNFGVKGLGCWCYYNFDKKNKVFGKLYNWYALNDTHKIAPFGFRIPRLSDWKNLFTFLGGRDDMSNLLKAQTGWESQDNGIDKYGFRSLPGGYLMNSGGALSFFSIHVAAGWWYNGEIDKSHGGNVLMESFMAGLEVQDKIRFSIGNKNDGYSIRCIKNK